MNPMWHWPRTTTLAGLVVLALACLVTTPAPADYVSDPPTVDSIDSYGDDYRSGDYGRIRYAEDEVLVLRAADDGAGDVEERAGINAPIFPGDRISTGPGERIEVQLASGALIRLDERTTLGFLALPRPYDDLADNTILQLERGNARVSIPDDEADFRLDTPACSVMLVGGADLRVEALGDETRVFSRRGVAEVSGDQGSTVVRAGTMTRVVAGYEPDHARTFNTFAADAFDRWVDERSGIYRAAAGGHDGPVYEEVYEDLPTPVRPYYGELSYYGDWYHTPSYGWVWYPSRLATGWRPYYHGHWSYGPGGYFWVASEPWGWAPYHYGRWAWVSGRGWGWVPGGLFAGAWVSWSWGPSYVGWCALDYWNRPIVVGRPYYSYYDPLAWSFVSYSHINTTYVNNYYVPIERVGSELRESYVVSRPPLVAPRQLATAGPWRERALRDVRSRPLPLAAARSERGFVRTEPALIERARAARTRPLVWDPLESTCRHASLSIL